LADNAHTPPTDPNLLEYQDSETTLSWKKFISKRLADQASIISNHGALQTEYDNVRRTTRCDYKELDTNISPDRENATSNDVVIMVMGMTGAGKSTFISSLVGQDDIAGHDLSSCW
jgi:ribosome biogenesis GTPase A